MIGALSSLAAELARLVNEHRGKRVLVADLFDGASRFDPSLIGDPDGLTRFRGALEELRTVGAVTLPAPRSHTGWDSRTLPPIPVWVMRTDPVPKPRAKSSPLVWPRALEAAGSIATRTDEQQMLMRIAEWMRDEPSPERVPVQERSLELFDDEKAIDGYLKNRLFTSGALTLDLLACYTPPLPFASQHVSGTGPTQLLVLENLATYTSFLTALRDLSPASRPDLHLGWGHGNAFPQSILGMPLLDPMPVATHYFGDLDFAGLQTAANAASQAAAGGLPALRPALSCYQFLFNGPRKWRKEDSSNRYTVSDYESVCRWLPQSLHEQARELLHARERIPQERLGLHLLRRNPNLWADLAPKHYIESLPMHPQDHGGIHEE